MIIAADHLKRVKYRPIYRFIATHSHQRVNMPIFTSYSWISYDTNTDIKLFEKCIANTIHPVLAVYLEVLLCKRAIGEASLQTEETHVYISLSKTKVQA